MGYSLKFTILRVFKSKKNKGQKQLTKNWLLEPNIVLTTELTQA